MSHDLTYTRGQYEFAYSGQSPWHNLGQRMPHAANREDIMRSAGLNWVVLPSPIYLAGNVPIPSHVANVRSDNGVVLGVVSADYRLVQIGEGLAFADELARSAGAHYYTAGSIRQGRQVFAAAKLPTTTVVVPGDVVEQYLLLVNSFDGSTGFHLRWTPVRVVCNNTLTAALAGRASYQYTVRHVGNLASQLDQARSALGMAQRYFTVAGEAFKALAARDLTVENVQSFMGTFLPLPLQGGDRTQVGQTSNTGHAERARAIAAREAVATLFESGTGTEIPRVRGTAWGMYNAATEYIDRVRTAKQDGTLRLGAASAAVLGVGQELRDRAMSSLLQLV